MATFDLNEHEQQFLVELLEREIPSLRDEIIHTDDHEYRGFLKQRERLVKDLLEVVKVNITASVSATSHAEKQGSSA